MPVWLLRQYNPDLDLSMVQAVDSGRHSGSGEPGSVTARRVALGLVVGPRASLMASAPWLADALLPPLLPHWGIENSRFEFGYPRWNGIDIAHFSLRSGGTVVAGDQTHIAYRLTQLVRGEVDSVVIDALTVRARPRWRQLPDRWRIPRTAAVLVVDSGAAREHRKTHHLERRPCGLRARQREFRS